MSLTADLLRPVVRAAMRRRILAPGRPVERQRADLERFTAASPNPRGVDYKETTLGGVPALRATPSEAAPGRRMLYLHGGAYVIGSARGYAGLAGRLAKAAAATAWILDYRLAPEHPHPAALDDASAALRALVESDGGETLALAGDSAGGGLALATLCRARDEGVGLPACTILWSPWLDLELLGTTMSSRAASDPVIDPAWLEESAARYAGDTDRGDPQISPLRSDLRGLPPMLVQVGSEEVLLDDAERLVTRALAVQVDVTLETWSGMWHDWPAFAPTLPEGRRAIARAGEYVASRVRAGVAA